MNEASWAKEKWTPQPSIVVTILIYILYLQRNLRKKKLIIPINQDNPYKSGIILLNVIYSYTHFPNLIYNYILLHKYIQETPMRKIQISNTLPQVGE